MKNTMMILALALASVPSFAAERPLQCHSTGVADGGYILTVAQDNKTAVLAAQTIAGPRQIDAMHCDAVANPAHPGPDQMQEFLECRSMGRVGGGYIARISAGGFWFHTSAQVTSFALTNHGVIEHQLQFGNLQCPVETE